MIAGNNNAEISVKKTEGIIKTEKRDVKIIFSSVFIFELIFGIYLGYFRGIVLNDALSRTANSFYVLFIKPNRLASIGFVWNPLPSILQLPIVLIAKIWRPIVSAGISADVITAFFAALSCVYIYRAFVRLNISKAYTLILIILYATNPFIFFYGANGMSEMIFFFMIIYIVIYMTLWIKEGSANYVLRIAFALAIAFFCRYEAIPLAFAVGLGIIIIILFFEREKKFIYTSKPKEKYFYVEGTMIVLYTPLLYSILLWILLNWTITGNPFYFLNSNYSNLSQSQYAASVTNMLDILIYVLEKCYCFMPLFIAIIIIRIRNKRLLKVDFIVLFFIVVVMIGFHFCMLARGASYGWLRFFSYSLPICFAWIPYELGQAKKKDRKQIFIILCIALLITSILTGRILSNSELSVEEHNLIISHESLRIANFINDDLSDEIVLMDAFLTSGTLLNVNNTSNLVISSSLNFKYAVKNPWKYGITYLLVPDSSGIGRLDAINVEYPDLYKNGAEWCTLVKEFDGFKLFKVNY